jgi:predicted RNA-binding Zn ribbon-like protein
MERIPYTSFAEKVDGLVLPAPLSGHPVLDFCNTFAGWDGRESGDYLRTYDHLAVWAAAAGLLDRSAVAHLRRRAAQHPQDAAAALDRARRFRQDLYAVLTRPPAPRALARVAAEVSAAADAFDLRPAVRTDGPVATWTPSARAGLELPVLAVARSAADLLVSEGARSVRPCPGFGCGWLFLDRSGRRRWCTMATCGNRAKARRFAERKRMPVRYEHA